MRVSCCLLAKPACTHARVDVQTSLNAALDTITAAVKELVCAEHVVVFLMDAARQVLWTSIANYNTHGQPRLFRVQQGGGGIIGMCAENKQQLSLCLLVSTAVQHSAARAAGELLRLQLAVLMCRAVSHHCCRTSRRRTPCWASCTLSWRHATAGEAVTTFACICNRLGRHAPAAATAPTLGAAAAARAAIAPRPLQRPAA